MERTNLLVHLVDVSPYSQRDPIHDYETVMKELEAFNAQLAKKPQILAANKIDLLGDDKRRLEMIKGLAQNKKLPFFAISALKNEGLRALVSAMASRLDLDGQEREA